jgi:hypothetical protein
MKKIIFIILVTVGVFALYYIGQGFMDAARKGGSPAARERRLAEISQKMNEGLPRQDGELTVLEKTTAGPGLIFTCVYKFPNHSLAQVDPAKLNTVAKAKAIKAYTNHPAMTEFRKWQVELQMNYHDKDGKEITTVSVSPKDL